MTTYYVRRTSVDVRGPMSLAEASEMIEMEGGTLLTGWVKVPS